MVSRAIVLPEAGHEGRVSAPEREHRFDALFEAYRSDIVAYCSWRARSQSDAQDAVAEVFLTAWRRLDDVPNGYAARVWLYAIARRVLANQRRSLRRRLALQERLKIEATPAPDAAGEVALVREALALLAPSDREILLLAEWEGLTAEQIASVVGCLAVTARGRLHRARRRFKSVFEELRTGEPNDPPAFLKEDLGNV